MARSLSNVKIVSAFVSQKLSNAIFRRGFAAKAAQESVSSCGKSVVSAEMKRKGVEDLNQKISWVPDPKTGYYRPDTGFNEIDPAELRAALLNNKRVVYGFLIDIQRLELHAMHFFLLSDVVGKS